MKKVLFSLVFLAFMVVSCGPSATEIKEKQIADSTRIADSIALVQTQQKLVADSIAKVDSIKKADSIAKLPKVKVIKKK
jgi:cell division protein FtsX